jgi:hypothetical protein
MLITSKKPIELQIEGIQVKIPEQSSIYIFKDHIHIEDLSVSSIPIIDKKINTNTNIDTNTNTDNDTEWTVLPKTVRFQLPSEIDISNIDESLNSSDSEFEDTINSVKSLKTLLESFPKNIDKMSSSKNNSFYIESDLLETKLTFCNEIEVEELDRTDPLAFHRYRLTKFLPSQVLEQRFIISDTPIQSEYEQNITENQLSEEISSLKIVDESREYNTYPLSNCQNMSFSMHNHNDASYFEVLSKLVESDTENSTPDIETTQINTNSNSSLNYILDNQESEEFNVI